MQAVSKPIRKILIANRGEIACRIAATCRRLGIATVAVYSEADADALHVRSCDEALAIGPAEAARSYLVPDKLVKAALDSGSDALHPGYGFLSENPGLAEACAAAGITFIGPAPEAIRAMGSKVQSRRIAAAEGIPCVPGYDQDDEGDQADAVLAAAAERIGFPLIIKASMGGGGKGIRVVGESKEFSALLDVVRREAKSAFGDARVLLERYVPAGRHIEVQVLGDAHGNLVHLADRECSLQRRHQKVIEEAPAPRLDDAARASMRDMALRLARAINYTSLGTVEFLYDAATRQFFLLEMNTRIQVEHPVTEMVTGLDLVELQIRVAEGRPLPFAQDGVRTHGHAIEARLNAERPEHDFAPSIGRIDSLRAPETTLPEAVLRFDTGAAGGSAISPYYDSMLAKMIAWAPDRGQARQALIAALAGLEVRGLATNADYLQQVLQTPEFATSTATTAFLDGFKPWTAARSAQVFERALMAAALHEALAREERVHERGGDDPWASLGGWRLLDRAGTPAADVLHFEDEAGVRHAVVVRGSRGTFRVALGDAPPVEAQARRTGQGLLVRLDGRAFTARVSDACGQVIVHTDNARAVLRLFDPGAEAEAAAASRGAGHDIVAPIPGLVVEVLVAAGDSVEAGQRLIVLEAMKMMHSLTASEPGVVAEVLCRQGEAVEMGRTLVRFAEAVGADQSAEVTSK
jgi:acetyl/propionyl-CoA carboxylase alpha subunit